MAAPVLELSGIEKSFADNTVLAGIDLEIRAGEVVALVGENGAGKSTLVRVITGAYRPDGGTVRMAGERLALRDVRDGMSHGIHAIYQEIRHNLFPQRSIADNLFMADRSGRFGRVLVKRKAMAVEARRLLDDVGLALDPQTRVGDLSISEQQMVEVAAAVSRDLSVLILDEPTAALEENEVRRLFAQIRRLQSEGVAIIYVSHRLEEVFELADRIVVLRDGRISTQGAASELTDEQVVRAMVGRPIDSFYPKEHHRRDEVVLSVQGLTRAGAFRDVSFDVRAGEILGIGGALGCGRAALLRAIFGEAPVDSGVVELDGRRLHLTNPRHAIREGIGFISEDRQRDGLFLKRSISDNVVSARLDEFAMAGGLVAGRKQAAATREVMDELSIRARSPQTVVGELSGGNQQKVLFAKWLVARPQVLLLEEPTRGVDVGAKVEIYRYLNQLTADGLAVVLVSSDLPELCEMSDRVLVMREGSVVAELDGDDVTQEAVLSASLGGAQ